MIYNKEWLEGVKATQGVLPSIDDLIKMIPGYKDRTLIGHQFGLAKDKFLSNLNRGLDTLNEERNIVELGKLAAQLVEEAESPQALS